MVETPICQVALSVTDLARSRAWYQGVGLEAAGGMGPMSGELPAQMLELPELEVNIAWMRARDSMSQLELIEFSRPTPRPLSVDWRPGCAGYGIVGYVVSDFEKTLREFRSTGIAHETTGRQGHRSIWIRDPDGIPVEIMETDPLGLHPCNRDDGKLASIRTITLTVDDLTKAKRFWTAAVGLAACPNMQFSFSAFPASLADSAADWEYEVVKGGSALIRLLRPRNATVLPRAPDYRLSDVGVLNIAVILDSADAFARRCERIKSLGYSFSTDFPMTVGDEAGTIYGHDDQRHSVEIGFVLPGHETKFGWRR
jgi:catechol 2,3-dioxygenase-like lactoylglutathione lyase family enzyme